MTIPKAAFSSAVEPNSLEAIQGTRPMPRKILVLGLLAASLVAPGAFARRPSRGPAE
jgi:hypothetical protein